MMMQESGSRLRGHYERNLKLEEELMTLTGKMTGVSLLRTVEGEGIKLQEKKDLLDGQLDVWRWTNRWLSRDMETNRHKVALHEAKLWHAERNARKLHSLNVRRRRALRPC